PGVVISGHPDRHVMQVRLGIGKRAIPAFLKREHRLPWRDRWAAAWAGLGFVSKSCREAKLLHALRQSAVGCPEMIAAGEDDRGRAFLLLRELNRTLDLRCYLDMLASYPEERRQFARRLGEALAQIHETGFAHPDLYAKHVLVSPDGEAIHFI